MRLRMLTEPSKTCFHNSQFLTCLLTGVANDLYSIFCGVIVENCERAAVDSATSHRGSACEIVVDRGPVVEVQPHHLFSICESITV
jgi:hypothetical protein